MKLRNDHSKLVYISQLKLRYVHVTYFMSFCIEERQYPFLKLPKFFYIFFKQEKWTCNSLQATFTQMHVCAHTANARV